MKRPLALLLVFIMAISLVGCKSGSSIDPPVDKQEPAGEVKKDFPVTIVDSYDREITIAKKPEKLVSLAPANTEILFAIGAGDKVFGVSTYCEYPDAALEKTKIGDFSNPNIELIIELEPDVVFVAAGVQKEILNQLEEVGIIVVTLDAENLEQVIKNIGLAGKIVGNEQEANKLVVQMEERIQAVKTKLTNISEKPTVFFEVWDEPLMTAGPRTFINDLINLAGGSNIASDATKQYGQFSLEVLLERDPDIYLINNHAHTPKDVMARPNYASLSAVKNKKVIALNDDLVTLPGPRLVEGLEEIAHILHPEFF